MFIEKVLEHTASRIKQWPVKSNRASELGHPCLRYLTYLRTRWEEKSLHDVGLQFLFDTGNDTEKRVIQYLIDAGFTVIHQQRPFEMKEYNITGTIDGKIVGPDNIAYPFDVKSCSPWVFKSINSIDDLKRSKHFYHHKYVAQLNLYLLMDGIDKGLFFFRSNGPPKEIWMSLDYDLAEKTIKKAEAVNAFVARNELPDRIDFDEGICGSCGFAHICLPDTARKEVEIDTGELAEMLKTYYQLESAAKEYKELNDEINNMVQGKGKIMAGDYFVSGKWVEKKNGTRYWKKSIVKI